MHIYSLLAASAAASDDPFGGGNSGGGGAGFADFSAFGSNQVSLISQRGDRSQILQLLTKLIPPDYLKIGNFGMNSRYVRKLERK